MQVYIVLERDWIRQGFTPYMRYAGVFANEDTAISHAEKLVANFNASTNLVRQPLNEYGSTEWRHKEPMDCLSGLYVTVMKREVK